MAVVRWEYLTVYLSGALDFPEAVGRTEQLIWAGKALTQQLNEHAAQGWEIIDLRWLSELEMMVTFRRPKPPAPRTRPGAKGGE
ncbi:MAG: hypothetical protein ACUVSU_01675 [Aggregatilineaceae bacterium]